MPRSSGIVAALVLLAGLSGCGRSTSGPPGAPGPTADAAAQQRAQRALLSSAELPLGFQRQDGSTAATAIGCPDIDRLYLAPEAVARAAVSFGHAITDAFVNETISVQPGTAAANVAAFGRAATDCRAFAGAQNASYRVSALPGIRRYGEATAAVRVTAAEREARPVDLVAVRLGDTVVVVANADSGQVDTDLTQTIVRRAVDKVRRLG
jgi:hypothetical protein